MCRALLELGTGMKDKVQVDPRLRDKRLVAQFLTVMAEKLNHPLRGWVSRSFVGGRVDWSKGGAWTVTRVQENQVKAFKWLFDSSEVLSAICKVRHRILWGGGGARHRFCLV